MPSSAQRQKIEDGIHLELDTRHYDARVKYRGQERTRRFKPDTDLDRIRLWRLQTLLDLKVPLLDRPAAAVAIPVAPVGRPPVAAPAIPPSPAPSTTTLEQDVEAYLPRIAGRACFKSDRSNLRAWLAAKGADGRELGKHPRYTLTTADIDVVIGAWLSSVPEPLDSTARPAGLRRVQIASFQRQSDGKMVRGYQRLTPRTGTQRNLSHATVRHRKRVLRELYWTLDGRSAPNPLADAKKYRAPKTNPVGVPEALIAQVLQTMAEKIRTMPTTNTRGVPSPWLEARQAAWAKGHARFLVVTTTAQRPVQVMRAEPDDVRLDLAEPTWFVRASKFEPAHTVVLTTEAVAAWRQFFALDCWGPYDTSELAGWLRECGWPKNIRPYNVRHSFSQDVLQNEARGVPRSDLAGHLGHTTTTMVDRNYAGHDLSRQRRVAAAAEGRLKAAMPGPRLVTK